MSEGAEFLTADEAIARLGVSRATFYNHARALDRFRRVGDKRVLYRVSDIEAMAEVQPVPRETTPQPTVVYKPRRRQTRRPPRGDG